MMRNAPTCIRQSARLCSDSHKAVDKDCTEDSFGDEDIDARKAVDKSQLRTHGGDEESGSSAIN